MWRTRTRLPAWPNRRCKMGAPKNRERPPTCAMPRSPRHRSPTPPPAGSADMLDDRDRIFRHLYGVADWGLDGARKRGAWDGTKAVLERGRDGIINEVKAS